MSLGFPAFFRQFWLHLRKNLRKNLQRQTGQAIFEMNLHTFAVFVCRMHKLQLSLANKQQSQIEKLIFHTVGKPNSISFWSVFFCS